MTQNDKVTADGFQEVFETNLFGHFILVKKKIRASIILILSCYCDPEGVNGLVTVL